MMKQQPSHFDHLLEKLEGDDMLWSIKDSTTGFALWPFIRHRVLFHLLYSRRKIDSIDSGHQSSVAEKIKSVIFALSKGNPFLLFFKRKKDILLFNSGISNVQQGDRYFNRLADYFHQAEPDRTAVVEETAYGKHSLPRHADVYSHFMVRLCSKFVKPFLAARKEARAKDIDLLVSVMQGKLGDDRCEDWFIQKLTTEAFIKMREVQSEAIIYRLFFRLVKARLILVEDGCYGSRAHLIQIAKAQSVKVAEYQHGFINRFHLAYNYGSAILSSNSFGEYFPEFLLTYGDYWGNVIRVPAKTISIGNPYLSEFTSNSRILKNSALILGAGVGAKAIIKKVLELHTIFSALKLQTVFRPHPLEWSNANEVYKELLSNGVKIDTFTNLYESFNASSVIVGELSTALFEAKRFTETVYLIVNDYMELFGDDALTLFPTVDEGIKTGFKDLSPARSGDFWQTGWRKAYQRFIQETIGPDK